MIGIFRKLFAVPLLAVLFLPLFSVSAQNVSTTTPSDTQALIQQLQELVNSLKVQIEELRAKIETQEKELAVVKSEIQFNTFLSRGSTGDEVRQLQGVLKTDPEIYPEGLVTGFFGPITEAAIKRFQQKHGIESLGIVGPKTRAKLNEFITEGAGASGIIPSGLPIASGISTATQATTTPEGKVIICHYPPGNPENKHTLEIDQSALNAHLAHGDIMGACGIPPVPSSLPPTPPPATTTPPAPPPSTATTTATTTPTTSPPPSPTPTPPPPSPTPPSPSPTPPPPGSSATTTAPIDTTAPVISNVQIQNTFLSDGWKLKTLTWITDEPSDTYIDCGLTTSYGNYSGPVPNPLTTSHSMNFSGYDNATYHCQVLSKDAAGNTGVSGDYTFDYTFPPSTSAPQLVISNVQAINIGSISVTITWDTSRQSIGTVYYAAHPLVSYTNDMAWSTVGDFTSHIVTITYLSPATTYYYQVVSKDSSGNSATSSERSFTTLPSPPPSTSTTTAATGAAYTIQALAAILQSLAVMLGILQNILK